MCSKLVVHLWVHSDHIQLKVLNRGEWEFPFPAPPFPFPKFGNEFFIPIPVTKIWECNFPFPFPLAGMDYNVGNKMGMEFKSWE